MIVRAHGEDLDFFFLRFGQQTFQLPELFQAEGSPIAAVESQYHGFLTAEIRQIDDFAVGGFQDEFGGRLSNLDTIDLGGAQIGAIFGAELGHDRSADEQRAQGNGKG
jgi:hypothetical protein